MANVINVCTTNLDGVENSYPCPKRMSWTYGAISGVICEIRKVSVGGKVVSDLLSRRT